MKVNILGTEYEIIKKAYNDEPVFKKNKFVGFCDSYTKTIIYCDLTTIEDWQDEPKITIKRCEMETLRHEIVHAFFNESGLQSSSFFYDGPYAKNEEMVDWIALQGEKIYKAWKSVGAIEEV